MSVSAAIAWSLLAYRHEGRYCMGFNKTHIRSWGRPAAHSLTPMIPACWREKQDGWEIIAAIGLLELVLRISKHAYRSRANDRF